VKQEHLFATKAVYWIKFARLQILLYKLLSVNVGLLHFVVIR